MFSNANFTVSSICDRFYVEFCKQTSFAAVWYWQSAKDFSVKLSHSHRLKFSAIIIMALHTYPMQLYSYINYNYCDLRPLAVRCVNLLFTSHRDAGLHSCLQAGSLTYR